MTVQNTKLSGYNPNRHPSSIPSYLGLPRISSWKKFANLFGLDTPNKLKCDCFCTGRSMVEMLGVLAIIGVLSVGAIAGYSKAMTKYKLNKQAEQLNTVINAVARNIHGFDNLKGSDDANQYITSYFIKLGEFPKEMIISGDNDRIYDIWKNKYFVTLTAKWIAIYVFMNLDIKSTETLEMCRNILITAKENSDNLRHVNLMSGFASDEQISEFFMGDRFCLSGNTCLRNITLDNIYSACTKHIGKQNAHLKITWDRKAN